MSHKRKTKPFEIDRSARAARRRTPRPVKQTFILQKEDGETITRKHEYETTPEEAEARQILSEAGQAFINTIEFYKSEYGGGKAHVEAVTETLQVHEWRRGYVSSLTPEEVTWADLTAVAEVDTNDALTLWARVRAATDDELECGKRGAKAAGDSANPYALA